MILKKNSKKTCGLAFNHLITFCQLLEKIQSLLNQTGRLSPVRETLLLIFSLKPENKAEWTERKLMTTLTGREKPWMLLCLALYYRNFIFHPSLHIPSALPSTRSAAEPVRSRREESCQNYGSGPTADTQLHHSVFLMQEAPLSETLGWRLAWKQITACSPCGWCLMGEMIQPGCCVIRSHAVRRTFPLLNPTKISQWTSNSVTRHDHIDLHLFKPLSPFSVTFRPPPSFFIVAQMHL